MQDNKTLIAIVAVVIVAAGAYYMLAGTSQAPTATDTSTETALGDTLPAATDSVDDFAAAMRADADATAAALQAFDAELSDTVTNVQTAGDATNLYDPENI